MKKLIFIVILIFFVSCEKSNSQVGSQSGIKFDEKNVLEFSDNKIFEGRKLSFIEVLRANYAQKELILLNCVNWENDPGDFRKIKIGSTEFVNMGGWTKVPEEYSKYSESDYFLELNLDNRSPVIVLFGYVYASDPGYLSVISLTGANPELIFNMKVLLKEVVMNGDNMGLVINFQGQDYNLYMDNGMLKFEKN